MCLTLLEQVCPQCIFPANALSTFIAVIKEYFIALNLDIEHWVDKLIYFIFIIFEH